MRIGITDLIGFVEVNEEEISEYTDHPVAKRKSEARGTPIRIEAAKLAAGAKLREYEDFDPRSYITRREEETPVPVIKSIESTDKNSEQR